MAGVPSTTDPSRLAPMFDAGSIAVVGASGRPGSVGLQQVRQLIHGGYQGRLHLVNPNHDQIEGIECVPDLESVGAVDLAVLAVANHRLEGALADAISAGARSVAIFASCAGTARDGRPLLEALRQMAADASLPVCGGNGMGFVDVERGVRVTGYYQPWGLRPGPVAFLSHSGSLFSALLHNHRHLRFNLAVSSGNELSTTMDEYLAHALERDSTRVVGLFLETVRRPDAMDRVLAEADRRRLPIVALKVGRTERGRASVATHAQALAGDHGGWEAFARSHGVHLVDTADELADALQAFSSPRRARPGGLGAVHDSGGERSLLIDLAADQRVPLAELGEPATDRIRAVLEPGLLAENPVDAWGTGSDFDGIFLECLRAVAEDDSVGAIALAVDLTPEERFEDGYVGVAASIASQTDKPVFVLSHLGSAVAPDDAGTLMDLGVPVLRGTSSGLQAIRLLFDHRDRAPSLDVDVREPVGSWEPWRRLAYTGELDALELAEAVGVSVVARRHVETALAAVAASAEIGYPVALKTASGAGHKSDIGGVMLGLEDGAAVEAAYQRLEMLGARAEVQAMAPAGIEMAVGLVRDPQFGPLVVIGAGGALVELLDDRVVLRSPVESEHVRAALAGLRCRPLFDGFRGSGAVDLDAFVETVVRLSWIGVGLGDVIVAADFNPLIVHAGGCIAVDGLVVARAERS